MFEYTTAIILGCIAAVALTVLLYIKVLPKKLDGTFSNKYLQFLHDFFHFKKLYLEDVLKFIFTLATVTCIAVGAFLLLGYDEYIGYYSTRKESTFLYGLILLIGGPVSLRLIYEGIMMFLLLVKNVMEINQKLPAPKAPQNPEVPPVQPDPSYPPVNNYSPSDNNGNYPPMQ